MTSPVAARPPRAPVVLRRPRLVENVVLVLLALIAIVDAVTAARGPVSNQLATGAVHGWVPGAYLALAVAAGGIVLAWWHPWPGLVLIAAAPLVSALLQWDPIATWNLAVFATFWLTVRVLPGLPTGLIVGVCNVAAVTLATGAFSPRQPTASIAGIAAVAAAGAGSAVRGHRLYWQSLEERARQASVTREAEASGRVAQERVRIARDLHDIVGHEVALVSLHLGTLEVHLPDDADAARADLTAARHGLQAVLAGTQQLLHVLRTGPGQDSTAPAAGYDHIDDLVIAARTAGLDVEATVDRPAVPLSPAVSAAAYRIVQEALTNAHKHGTGAVSLTIDVDEQTVRIEVVNVRKPAESPTGDSPSGYGLVGMRERATSVGGWIDTNADDTLFWLWAQLPIDRGGTP